MADSDLELFSTSSQMREFIGDIDSFLGLEGNFWQVTTTANLAVETPTQVQDICRSLLVDLFGLEVQGL